MPRKKSVPVILFRGSVHLKQWQKCYDEWLLSVHEKSGSADTIRGYRSDTAHFFIDPKRAPDTYTREEVTTFIRRQSRHKDGVMSPPSPYTQNRRLAVLKSFYDFAMTYRVPYRDKLRPICAGERNPTIGIQAIKPGKPRKGLNEEELKQLFAAIRRRTPRDKRDYAIFSFYFWTARRREEIVRLKWGDISEVVFIENGVSHVGHIYRFSTKGHSRDVFTAELRPEAWDALLDYLKASGRYERMKPESPLFVDSRYHAGPETALSGQRINIILHQYAEFAGLQVGRKISLHWIRHTRAQLQWMEDQSDKALTKIQKLLMHENISTTMLYLAGAEERPDDGGAILANKLGKL